MAEQFKKCVYPCPRYITGRDTHSLCVVCLGAQHARSALEGADCEHCEALPDRVLRSRLAVFDQAGQARFPRGSGPAAAEAARRLRSWGSQLELFDAIGPAEAVSQSSSDSYDAIPTCAGAREAASTARGEDPMLELSTSEDVDVLSVEAGDMGSHWSPRVPAYEELIEVVTRAVARLDISWPSERQEATVKRNKLDERFLQHRARPKQGGLPFFPELHNELCKSWNRPYSSRISKPTPVDYSNVLGAREEGYKGMPRVEEALASYLSQGAAASLKTPVLPTKPYRKTSDMVGRAYMAAGQAGACLHTMAILQAYQADLLADLEEGGGPTSEDVAELRRATDLSLRVTKETARAVGRSMAALVATERHLWLNLAGIKEKEKDFLLDAPLSPSGLFGEAVSTVVERYQEGRRQSAVFQQCFPRRTRFTGAGFRTDQPQPSSSSTYRQIQKVSVASRAPPQGARQQRRRFRPKPAQQEGDLRVLLQNKKALGKRS